MIFSGISFCSGKYSLDYTPTYIPNVTFMKIKNGIFDDLYVSKNGNMNDSSEIPTDWDFNTILYAMFKNNLLAGNIEYTSSQVSSIRLKRRIKNTYDWITLFEIPVSDSSDFIFERYDFYNQSNIEYEYALVPVINNIEGTMSINEVLSEFEGIFILEKDRVFKTILDIELQSQKNRPNTIVNTIDRKYPFVVSNGQNNYYSGSVSATFIEQDNNSDFKINDGWKFRESLMEFLQNGKPKILKYDDGRMWLVSIVDNPSEQPDGHPQKITTTFNWVETGDAKSSNDLYDYNFINVDL
ncbi:hypothetical protein [Sinanaerobacter chloroacetimidivorans]|uniref:Uncharacterized protein n=1 Tax=Sinanaerobacter chloroacetimidivorans TaxID=2818044 RepID=A0A8J7VZR6_9FIRM|nr:hypothetical protein [Sinanaerobacter chloroacetimidivorans]MBR0596968.1 hypothetical protein [Sinanaerobacter chloroacetimidivorans]